MMLKETSNDMYFKGYLPKWMKEKGWRTSITTQSLSIAIVCRCRHATVTERQVHRSRMAACRSHGEQNTQRKDQTNKASQGNQRRWECPQRLGPFGRLPAQANISLLTIHER